MEDCIFCKIINQEIPSYKIYEDDVVYAFLDISQVTPGHTLIVPKNHASDIFEYDEELASQVFTRVPKIAKALQAAYPEMQGLNIVNNNKEVAYQTVFHSHIHLIPRYSKHDDFSMHFGNHTDQYNPELLNAIAKRIQTQFEA